MCRQTYLRKFTEGIQFQTVQELKSKIVEEWNDQPQKKIKKLYKSISKRLIDVTQRKGYHHEILMNHLNQYAGMFHTVYRIIVFHLHQLVFTFLSTTFINQVPDFSCVYVQYKIQYTWCTKYVLSFVCIQNRAH